MAEVSLVVPVYNVEEFLARCLDTLRRQTLADIEIICVNDGSRDRSRDILALAQQVDDRIRIIDQPNSGLSAARNTGLRQATGRVVMFVDSDDMLEPKACATVLKAFDKYDPDLVTFGASIFPSINGTPWLRRVLSPRDAVYKTYADKLLFKENSYPFVWRTAVSREFLTRTNLVFDESVKFGEDMIFHFMAYPASRRTVLLSDSLYIYRADREGSLMQTRQDNLLLKLKEHQIVARRILSHWKRQGWLQESAQAIAEWAIDFLVLDLMGHSAAIRARVAPGFRTLMTQYFSATDVLQALPKPHQAILKQVSDVSYRGTVDPISILAYQYVQHGPVRTAKTLARHILSAKPLAWTKEFLRSVLPQPASRAGNVLGSIRDLNDDATRRSLATQLLALEVESRSTASPARTPRPDR